MYNKRFLYMFHIIQLTSVDYISNIVLYVAEAFMSSAQVPLKICLMEVFVLLHAQTVELQVIIPLKFYT